MQQAPFEFEYVLVRSEGQTLGLRLQDGCDGLNVVSLHAEENCPVQKKNAALASNEHLRCMQLQARDRILSVNGLEQLQPMADQLKSELVLHMKIQRVRASEPCQTPPSVPIPLAVAQSGPTQPSAQGAQHSTSKLMPDLVAVDLGGLIPHARAAGKAEPFGSRTSATRVR